MGGAMTRNEDGGETNSDPTSLQQRLRNYKQLHAEEASKKRVSAQFAAARTLTEAKKVLWGEKRKAKPLRKSKSDSTTRSRGGTNGDTHG